MDVSILFKIFIFLASACVIVPIANRFRLSSVIGYLLVGIIIGPYCLGILGDAEGVMNIAEFGVVMMLFLIGLELEPSMLWRLRHAIIGLGGLQVVLTSLAFTAIGIAIGYHWQMSLAIGMALALSSTAIVLQTLQENNLLKTMEGESAFSVLLFQDIAVIPILIILPLLGLSTGNHANLHTNHLPWHLTGWQLALLDLTTISLVILSGRYLSRYLFFIIAKTHLRELFTAFSLALVIGIALLMLTVGLSPALGAFVAGVVLANSEYKKSLEADIQPFKGLLLGLFFITVGMSMNLPLLATHPGKFLLALFGLISVKLILLIALARLFKLTQYQSLAFAFFLAQGGEFAFVLLQYALSLHVITPEVSRFFTLTVALSMATTPFVILFYQKYIEPNILFNLPASDFDKISEKHPIILAGYGRFGQIIGRFLNAQGIHITVLEKDPEQIKLLRKFGYHAWYGDASRPEHLANAGAENAKLLIVAIGNATVNLEVVRLAKQLYPNLKIYARARNRRHAYELHRAGVNYFKRELFDSSLSMAEKILRDLAYSPAEIERKAKAFTKHDNETLEKSFEFFDQEKEIINLNQKAKGELAQLLDEAGRIQETAI
ncbi:monovalent cation:proton antiporter-2 (CPA2) family protein [Legionella sp. W05-934-2]|jgi:monovalent cation:proton antiporter-2 (CPA2) family protein|uniref:monovalent cation:proton antiporter-2 (CPA2) family protein n=1 Tax=Legionella sp. W05-934-2 TaxID=1198649 RepID=UPI0034623B6A